MVWHRLTLPAYAALAALGLLALVGTIHLHSKAMHSTAAPSLSKGRLATVGASGGAGSNGDGAPLTQRRSLSQWMMTVDPGVAEALASAYAGTSYAGPGMATAPGTAATSGGSAKALPPGSPGGSAGGKFAAPVSMQTPVKVNTNNPGGTPVTADVIVGPAVVSDKRMPKGIARRHWQET